MNLTTFEALTKKQPCFFLGANSGSGFYNGFDQIYDPKKADRLYVLKGGPGTGKSTLMKRMALAMEQIGQPCELYFCSSDPRSLDGVRFPKMKTAIVDGTAPHIMEAKYLGVSERLVDLGRCLDMDQLEAQAGLLLPLYEQNARLHKRASRFLEAAAGLIDDSFSADCECSDLEKAEEIALRLCKNLLPSQKAKGKETKRFLSGATPDGLVLLEDSLKKTADEIYAIEDEFGGTSSVMLSVIRGYALDAGYEIITCPCALSPHRKIDHIVIPDRRLAFCTSNWMMPITVDTQRRIHAKRFRNPQLVAQRKQRLRFNRRASEELLDAACHYIEQARAIHDDMEAYYIKAMDFSVANEIADRLEKELLDRARK